MGTVVQPEAVSYIINKHFLCNLHYIYKQVANLKKGLKKQAFAAVMAHPVGTDFIPSLAHRELCKPKVATAAGIIIDPISKDMVGVLYYIRVR